MRLIGGCACIAALLVFSTSDASAQSRGTIAVSVRVIRSTAPQAQTQTQTQTQLTQTDGTSSQLLTDASGQPITDASGRPVTTQSDAAGNTVNGLVAPGDVAAPPTGPSSTPLSRFRVLTINY